MSGSSRIILAAVVTLGVLALLWYGLTNMSRASQMSGVIVKVGEASVAASDQMGATDHIVVDSVTAPEPSWLVVYRVGMEGMPGALLGYAPVPAGVSSKVSVPIDPSTRLTQFAIVSLNADRGVPGRFEFAMDRFEASPDKPYYADGRAVQTKITVAFPEMVNTFEVPTAPVQTP